MRRGAGGDLVGHPEEAQVLILGLSVTSHLQELRAFADPEGTARATRYGSPAPSRGLLAVLHVGQAPAPRRLAQQRGDCGAGLRGACPGPQLGVGCGQSWG